MFTWIVTHSEALCNFLQPLLADFSEHQQRHALNVVEAPLVSASKHKTLAALTRLLVVPHADEYALADFFRRSPWRSAGVQQAVTRFVLRTVARLQALTGWRLLFLSVDDALCRKDVATHALEAVSLHYDHVAGDGVLHPNPQPDSGFPGGGYPSTHLSCKPPHVGS